MRLALLALALVACHGDEEAPHDLAATVDMAAPYAGSVTLAAGASIAWEGGPNDGGIVDDPITAAHFEGGTGTITFAGRTLPALVYQVIPFSPYTLGAIVATTTDGLLVAYAYCKDGALTTFYSETLTQSTIQQGPLSTRGTCTFGTSPVTVDAMFTPPSTLTYASPVDIADVAGTDLTIHGGKGTAIIDGTSYDVDVFTSVDCAACGNGGWQELHVTLRKDGVLAFAILYLNAGQTTRVQVGYGFRFDRPALWPANQFLTATWALK